jgi:hypothetical protein
VFLLRMPSEVPSQSSFLPAAVPLALFVGGTTGVNYVDSLGLTFFHNGKDVLGRMAQFSAKLKARDANAMEAFFSPQFQGSRLGLNDLKEVHLKDGIHRLLLTGGKEPVDRAGALAEWRAYVTVRVD